MRQLSRHNPCNTPKKDKEATPQSNPGRRDHMPTQYAYTDLSLIVTLQLISNI